MSTGTPSRVAVGPAAGAADRRPSPVAAVAAVYGAQLARVRVARGPLLFVAVLQSIGILVLLRGVVDAPTRSTAGAIVAGSAVLVVAFVALNLLAQRFGTLRSQRALDYYAALPISPAAVVIGTAAAFATLTIPGVLLTTAVGAAMYGLPMGGVWMSVPAGLAAGVALSGLGAALGLVLPRVELATVAGQLAMTAVLFLGVIPPGHLPVVGRVLRDIVPSTYAVDALAGSLRGTIGTGAVVWRLVLSLALGAVGLAVATWSFRRAVDT